MCSPLIRSSRRSQAMPLSRSRSIAASRQPQVKAMCCGKFSALPMTRGLSQTDMRIA